MGVGRLVTPRYLSCEKSAVITSINNSRLVRAISLRSHYVYVNGANSSTLPVLSGVPQGSILGPLLFIIYVNDLPVSINRAACYLFADDTKLLKSISSPTDTVSLQDDIIAVEAWCRKWNLSLNSSKCCAIRFTLGKCDNGTYILNNTPIKFTNLQRDSLFASLPGLVCTS